jgi:TonB-linked SusC/RagA family outer membrane protein
MPSGCRLLLRAASCGVALFLLLVLGSAQLLEAQVPAGAPSGPTATLEGRITSAEDGRALTGAVATLEEPGARALAGADGRFRLEGITPGRYTLTVAFLGHRTSEQEVVVTAGEVTRVDVVLESSPLTLDGVVVTALGVEREQRSIGYSVQTVRSEQLEEVIAPNFTNMLAGKVAGVAITSGSSGANSTSRVVIRGERSLAGDSQPLFVVDGVPLRSGTDRRTEGGGNFAVDFGNGAADLNPAHIESVTVLKGPNAAALYGSRAANGVILIETKRGRQRTGLGFTATTSVMNESVLRLPRYQTEYGAALAPGNPAGLPTGTILHLHGWGPRIADGANFPQLTSPTEGGRRGGDIYGPGGEVNLGLRGAVTPQPLQGFDNARNFFETGRTISNSLAVSGASDAGSFRFSFTELRNRDIVPNTGLDRRTVSLNSRAALSDRVTVRANATYVNTDSPNRIIATYGSETPMYYFGWVSPDLDIRQMREYWAADRDGWEQFTPIAGIDNPYFMMYENRNSLDRDRLLGSLGTDILLGRGLQASLQASVENVSELLTFQRAFSQRARPRGQYREDMIRAREVNASAELTWRQTVSEDLTLELLGGGNLLRQSNRFNRVRADELVIPNLYNFSNAAVPIVTNNNRSERELRSLFARAQLGWRNLAFLEVTGRNDWSSALPENNLSYFYPSASFSLVASELLDLPEDGFLAYAQLRLSAAQVGSDTGPYRLRNTFSFGQPFGSNPQATQSNTLNNPELRPEIVTSYELGADVGLFGGRVNLDWTVYSATSRNQILAVNVSQASGYGSRVVNAGAIDSHGWEVLADVAVVDRPTFGWSLGISAARDRSYVASLPEGVESYTVEGIPAATSSAPAILVREGERMGTMYGRGVLRHEGQVVWRNGRAVPDNTLRPIGNYNPDWSAGFSSDFRVGSLSIRPLFDLRVGGEFVSFSRAILTQHGLLEDTLVGREDGLIGEGVKEVLDADGNVIDYVPNDVRIDAFNYYNTLFDRANTEMMVYDAGFLKLRELAVSYRLPQRWLGATGLANARVSLVGRDLFLWTDNPHFDPEVLAFRNKVLPGFEDFSLPSTRSVGLYLSVDF